MSELELSPDAFLARQRTLLASFPPSTTVFGDINTLTLRPAGFEDAAAIHNITACAFAEFRGLLDPANGSELEDIEAVANQMVQGGALIALLDGVAVASLRLTFFPDYLYVGRVGALPEYRGRGIASRLMGYTELVAQHLGYTEIRLGTREKLQSNVDLYLRLGYQIDTVFKHPRGTDNVVLFSKRMSPDA